MKQDEITTRELDAGFNRLAEKEIEWTRKEIRKDWLYTFAGRAMQGYRAGDGYEALPFDVAKWAANDAEALLAELEKREAANEEA